MTTIHRLGRSVAVALVALLLTVGAVFAYGIAFQPKPASPTINQPAFGPDETTGTNNQVGIDETTGTNNQVGIDEKDGPNNQAGIDETNGQNN
jgi:hypothetical protein